MLAGQMEYNPVTLAQLAATIRFHDIAEGGFAIGEMRVTTQYLNHPALTLGYRLQSGDNAVVYSVDHEPHAPNPAARAEGEPPRHKEDQRHIEFPSGRGPRHSRFSVYVAEYPQKTGWGHTPAEWAVDYALAARAKRLALTHHDPLRDDEAVDRVAEMCRRRASAAGSGLEVFAAGEGQQLRFIERDAETPAAARAPEPARKVGAHTILVADYDPTIVRLLTLALEQDGFLVVTASDGEAALRLARLEQPDLILLDWQMSSADGMEVKRRLRNEPDPALRDVPVVLITAQSGPENTTAGFAAGVTDYLTKPFRPAYVRARVQAWLLRPAPHMNDGSHAPIPPCSPVCEIARTSTSS
jgi:CheY-like chemotaxis protein